MSPIFNYVMDVVGRCQQEKVSPFVEAYVQASILVHPEKKYI